MIKLSIFVPQTKDDAEFVTGVVIKTLIAANGGASSYDLQGYYQREDDGSIDVEHVKRIDSLVESEALASEQGEDLASYVKGALGEECVLIEMSPVDASFL